MTRISPCPHSPGEQMSFEQSLWYATACASGQFTRLVGDQRAQVVVIGAGYTGLASALTLASNHCDVVLLDAYEPGFGASGRNGGQVIPAFKYDPGALLQTYGESLGRSLLDLIAGTADTVFTLIRRYDIDCDPEMGWIQLADSAHKVAVLAERGREWQAYGAPVEIWDASRLATGLGTRHYRIGMYFRNAGTVQPLSYARGLARAAQSEGARIHTDSPALAIHQRGEGWEVVTPQGRVRCEKVVLATNAYTPKLWPGLRESVVPVYSMQIASEPLPQGLRSQVLPEVAAAADTHRLVSYYRRDAQGRFIFGYRGPFRAFPRLVDARRLRRAAIRLFPQLEGVDFPYRWSGRVAMTVDHVPHLHVLAPGVFAALGYNGRGVALATTMGRILASACLAGSASGLAYPVTPLHPIPLHAFHKLGVLAMVEYYRLLDRLR